MAVLFDRDEHAYLDWVEAHPRGYVVNLRRTFDPDYLVLHRASCHSIQSYAGMDRNPGGFTERDYLKLCGERIEDLERFIRTSPAINARTFSRYCGLCKP